MSHFGVISPPVAGHINPFLALARELQRRGHTVTFFQMADLENKVRAEEVGFQALGETDHPRGSLAESLARLGTLRGLAALRFTIRAVQRTTEMICRDAPPAIRRAGVDMLLVDQSEPAGASVAEHLGIPFVTVCNALPLHRDASVPPPFTGWSHRLGTLARWRNTLGYAASDRLLKPVSDVIADHRRRWRLPAIASVEESQSRLAQISQLPAALEYPRTCARPEFHCVGPLRFPSAKAVSFPWERLDGRPLVYASLGTLQNGREHIFRVFAEACRGLNVQLVVSHAYGLSEQQAAELPGSPLVVSYAPQVELLARARLTLTHAGLNTVLDSLTHGVPVVAVPITYEQPAIAERVRWAGAGEVLPMARLHPDSLRTLIERVMGDSQYSARAARVGNSIRQGGGVGRAADLIVQALHAQEPTERAVAA